MIKLGDKLLAIILGEQKWLMKIGQATSMISDNTKFKDNLQDTLVGTNFIR